MRTPTHVNAERLQRILCRINALTAVAHQHQTVCAMTCQGCEQAQLNSLTLLLEFRFLPSRNPAWSPGCACSLHIFFQAGQIYLDQLAQHCELLR